jgi:hypothetical protein
VAQQGFPPRRPSRPSQPSRDDYPDPDDAAESRPGPDGPPWDSPSRETSGRHGRPAGPAAPAAPAGPARTSHRAPSVGEHGGTGDHGARVRAEERPAPQGTARPERPARGERDWLKQDPFADDEGEAPPWAGPGIYATRAGGGRMGPPPAEDIPGIPDADAPPRRRRGRAAAARLRRSRRRVYVYCGTAIVAAVIIALIAVIATRPSAPPKTNFISTLQPGEFKAVPNACTAVSPALLSQYLPGTARRVTPMGTGGSSSQCSFTVDRRPVFRVLEITMQAYQPSLIVAGNGSATAGATDAFAVARQALVSPGKKSPLPRGQVTTLTGLGQQAISAIQVLRVGRTVTDFVTVLARERNVVLTVSLQAQTAGGGYGPVSVPALEAGTQAISRDLMTKAETEPKIGR